MKIKSNSKQWFSKLESAMMNFEKSIDSAGDATEKYLRDRTDSLTPTLSGALIGSRMIYQELDENSLEIILTYNEDGSAPYAIEQHETDYYSHDYEHNPAEAQSFKGGTALRFARIPLVDEREIWWRKAFKNVGWKK